MKTSGIWSRWLSATLCLCGTLASAQETPKPTVEDKPPAGDVRVIEVQGDKFDVRSLSNQGVLIAAPIQAEDVSTLFLYADPNQAGAGEGRRYVAFAEDGQPEPGKYWIGLLCVDAGEALREQLGLEPGVGLLVEAVTEEAPAKKAGVQKNDVVISLQVPSDDPKAEPKPLKQVMELVEAVQKTETKPLRLTLVRRGQKQTLEVTPAERPQAQATPARVTLQLKQAENQLQQLLQAQRNQAEAHANQAAQEADRAREAVRALDQKLKEQHLALRLAGPMFVPPTEAPKLPEGMTMEFHQIVGQPEQIIVRKGDQKWEVTAEQLDKLPEDVRVIVAQQMAARRGAFPLPVPNQAVVAWKSAVPGYPAVAPQPMAMPSVIYGTHTSSGTSATARLPDDVSISITRTGSDPARITVKNKEQSWEITEKELDKLPADLRKHVESLLSPRGGIFNPYIRSRSTKIPVTQDGASNSAVAEKIANDLQLQEALRRHHEATVKSGAVPSAGASDATRQLQERQEAMLKQLQQLTEKVEKLQETLEKSAPKQ